MWSELRRLKDGIDFGTPPSDGPKRYSAGRAMPGGWGRLPLSIALSAGRHLGCRRSLDIVFGEIDR